MLIRVASIFSLAQLVPKILEERSGMPRAENRMMRRQTMMVDTIVTGRMTNHL
jgi:hypothetical protein